ncbi:MAG TPA: hypothetical protein VGM25_14565 [Caulobacteraceae bacterium]
MADEDFNRLIPEMPAWNNGAGIDPMAWIGCTGTNELAVGYSLIFWPRFILIDQYVLRDRGPTTEARLRDWERSASRDRQAIEAVMNHWHVIDLHASGTPATEAQLRYLGRVLKEIHEVKLRSDFPDRAFIVGFNDEPDLDLVDYHLSFWQT